MEPLGMVRIRLPLKSMVVIGEPAVNSSEGNFSILLFDRLTEAALIPLYKIHDYYLHL